MSKAKKIIYVIMTITGLIVFFLGAIPLGTGDIHIGVIAPMIFGISVTMYSLLSLKYPVEDIPWKDQQTEEYRKEMDATRCYIANEKPKMRKTIIMGMKNANLQEYDENYEIENKAGLLLSRETRVKLDRIIWILIALAILVTSVISIIMVKGYDRFDGEYSGQTVVTLGCKVNGDRPSATLKKRLDKTIELLEEYPEAKVIVTGGQGENETQPESQVMKKYLVEKGISEERILEENKSSSTKENLEYAQNIAVENGISKEFILVTDGYHEYRGNKYAKGLGIKSEGYPSKSVKGFGFAYWCREIFINVYEIFIH